MISLKKLSLYGLLMAGSSSLFGMESGKSVLSTAPAAKEDTSAKLQASFNTLMNDLYAIAEKINDSVSKREARNFLDKRLTQYSAIIPLSNKLELVVNKIYPTLQQGIGDEQQVSMLIDAWEEKFGPSKLQSRIIQDMRDDERRGTFNWSLIYVDDKQPELQREAHEAFDKFSQKDVGTLYDAASRVREKNVGTVAIQDIKK